MKHSVQIHNALLFHRLKLVRTPLLLWGPLMMLDHFHQFPAAGRIGGNAQLV